MSHRSVNPEQRNPFSILNQTSQPPILPLSTAEYPAQLYSPQLGDVNCRRYKRSFDSTEKEKATKMRSLAKIYDNEIMISHQIKKESQDNDKSQQFKGVYILSAYQ
jgi:hypothetical protein